MPEITGSHHLSVRVTDLDKSAAWWTEVLGCEVFTRVQRDGMTTVVMRYFDTSALEVGSSIPPEAHAADSPPNGIRHSLQRSNSTETLLPVRDATRDQRDTDSSVEAGLLEASSVSSASITATPSSFVILTRESTSPRDPAIAPAASSSGPGRERRHSWR